MYKSCYDLDRVTKNGEKATFMMKAGERILADYSVMSGWPTLHGMFVIKNELRRFFFVSLKYCNKCIVEHVCVTFMFEFNRFRWSTHEVCLGFTNYSAQPI